MVYFILKEYKPQAVLFAAGYALLIIAWLFVPEFTIKSYILQENTTDSFFLNIFTLTAEIFKSRTAQIGLNLMAVGGFARYIEKTGANTVLVALSAKPLSSLKSPYLMLMLAYLLSQLLSVLMPSSTGLALLLMVTLAPMLMAAGVSKTSAMAVVCTCSAVSFGPVSNYTIIGADIARLPVLEYVKYQLPLALCCVAVIAVAHLLVQKRYDKAVTQEMNCALPKATKPMAYGILPFIPFALLLSVKGIDIVTAVLASVTLSLILDIIISRNLKKSLSKLGAFFEGMGFQFAVVVTLVVAGDILSKGLIATGFIDSIIRIATALNLGSSAVVIIASAVTGVFSAATGSGYPALVAFSGFVTELSLSTDTPLVATAVPMQLCATILRYASPVTPAIVAVAAMQNMKPLEIVKRTAIPSLAGAVTAIIISLLIF